MFGIRERNYNYDINDHSTQWPKYADFLNLKSWLDITDEYIRNLLIERSEFDPIFHRSLFAQVKCPWPGLSLVKENHSQSWQDLFVLTALNGKKNGYWLELGASDPVYMNNTYLLESRFEWTGISVDTRTELLSEWAETRTTSLSILDALKTDWHELLKNSPQQIDYLQADLADWATLKALKELPHDTHRFSVITFEHDVFQSDPRIQVESREFLKSLGYQLLISNVAVKNYATNTWEPFEDWWVDPNTVNISRLYQIADATDTLKLPHQIFINC